MGLPVGCTYVTVLSVDAYDDGTSKPTLCTCEYDVNGQVFTDQFNIGLGFLASLTLAVANRKRYQASMTLAQSIVNNKTS